MMHWFLKIFKSFTLLFILLPPIIVLSALGTWEKFSFIYHHPIFIALLVMLFLNILFCSLSRWKEIRMKNTVDYMTHISIIVIIIGAFITGFLGFRGTMVLGRGDSSNTITSYNGKIIHLPFSIHCNRFYIEFYPKGRPKAYITEGTIDGKRFSLSVNHPLKYKGLWIYQEAYDVDKRFSYAVFEISGKKIKFPLNRLINTGNLMLYIDRIERMKDKYIAHLYLIEKTGEHISGWIKAEEKIGDITFKGANIEYKTILDISYDPGSHIIITGFILFTIATFLFIWEKLKK